MVSEETGVQYRGRAAGAQCKYSGLASDCTNSSSACHGDGCWRQTVRAHAGGGLAHASKRSFSVQGAAAALDEAAIPHQGFGFFGPGM